MKRYFLSFPGFSFRSGIPLLTIPLVFACLSRGDREAHPAIGDPVLLILVDGLRADHLGSYDYGKPTSPHLDRLAAEGVRFEQAVSPADWTLPAVSSLFTSLYPIQHGVLRHHERQGDIQPVPTLAGDHRTLAERLAGTGYQTVAYVANPFLNRQAGFDQGFDAFHFTPESAGEIFQRFLDWYDRERPERFFAYLHLMDLNWPYRAGLPHRHRYGADQPAFDYAQLDWDDLRTRLTRQPESVTAAEIHELRALYDGAILALDEDFGRFLEGLVDRGLEKKSFLILTSDHGQEIGEHGRFLHSRSLKDTVLRVPLLLRFPDHRDAGRVVEEQVRLIDLLPSILDAIGSEPGSDLTGRSLLPLIRSGGKEEGWPEYAYGEYLFSDRFYRQSVRTSDHKLIRTLRRTVSDDDEVGEPEPLNDFLDAGVRADFEVSYQLHDLRKDPGEETNLFSREENQKTLRRLRNELDRWFEENAYRFDATEPAAREVSPERMEPFKEWGYPP